MEKKLHILPIVIFLTMVHSRSTDAATHTVINTNDSGAGSLRQAIIDANADAGPTRLINFAIPGTPPFVITPLTFFDLIVVPNTTVDGTSQAGWAPNSPVIVIDGSSLPAPGVVTGMLTISATDNCIIQGFVLNNASKSQQLGILITDNGAIGANNNAVYGCFIGTDVTGTIAAPNRNGMRVNAFTNDSSNNNIIGGPNLGQRNLISGNTGLGLYLLKNTNSTVIQNNYIGTDITGTLAIPNNAAGILVQGSLTPLPTERCTGTIIGGPSAQEGNLISGNANGTGIVGIALQENVFATVIQNNLIGVDVTGTLPLPNDLAILAAGNSTIAPVDGTSIQGNVISASTFNGIALQENITNSTITGNFIGTDKTGTLNLGNGNSGILIQSFNGFGFTFAQPLVTLAGSGPCFNNAVGGTNPGDKNIICFNGQAVSGDQFGVFVQGDNISQDDLNPILENSIFLNKSNGIELQTGGNNLQIPPILISALLDPINNNVIVKATAPTTPAASNFRLEFFTNNTNRNPITEGQRFIGAIPSVPSGTTVQQVFTVPLPLIPATAFISATATNLNNTGGTPGDTSPFTLNLSTTSAAISPISMAIIINYCSLI